MPLSDTYRRKCEDLLRRAAETADLKERSRLLDEAVEWHRKAVQARGRPLTPSEEG